MHMHIIDLISLKLHLLIVIDNPHLTSLSDQTALSTAPPVSNMIYYPKPDQIEYYVITVA